MFEVIGFWSIVCGWYEWHKRCTSSDGKWSIYANSHSLRDWKRSGNNRSPQNCVARSAVTRCFDQTEPFTVPNRTEPRFGLLSLFVCTTSYMFTGRISSDHPTIGFYGLVRLGSVWFESVSHSGNKTLCLAHSLAILGTIPPFTGLSVGAFRALR